MLAKVDKLQRLYRAKVFLVIRKGEEFYSYTTSSKSLTVKENVRYSIIYSISTNFNSRAVES